MAKRRMTPFARFFIVMLIIVPLAYFGASWYNGDDPLSLRDKLGLDTAPREEVVNVQADRPDTTIERLELRIGQLEKELQQCRQELEGLKAQTTNQK